MNIQYNYYNFENLDDMQKDKFILYILKKCKYQIDLYKRNLGSYYQDDFFQEIAILIYEMIKKKKFKFQFFKSYQSYKKKIKQNKLKNISFIYSFLNNKYLLDKYDKNIVSKNHLIKTKDFYLKYKKYCFECKFLSYIRKIIKRKYIRISINKSKFLNHSVELSDGVINHLSYQDENIKLLNALSCLTEEEKKFIALYNIKTQSEIAKEFNTSQQNISYKLCKIRKKLKKYE